MFVNCTHVYLRVYVYVCLLLWCLHAAGSDSGALRAIKAAGSSGPMLEFGAVQTQQAGSAADVRRRFAAQPQ